MTLKASLNACLARHIVVSYSRSRKDFFVAASQRIELFKQGTALNLTNVEFKLFAQTEKGSLSRTGFFLFQGLCGLHFCLEVFARLVSGHRSRRETVGQIFQMS